MKSLSRLFGLMSLCITLAVCSPPWQQTNAAAFDSPTYVERTDALAFTVINFEMQKPDYTCDLAVINYTLPETHDEQPPYVAANYRTPTESFTPLIVHPPIASGDTKPNYPLLETVWYQEVLDTGGLQLMPSHEVLQTFYLETPRPSDAIEAPQPAAPIDRCRGTKNISCSCADCARRAER